MKKIAFDNNLYIKMQTEKITERIQMFDNKLYLEFGGKLFDDFHASRVLPGFEPDTKIKMLLEMKERAVPSQVLLDGLWFLPLLHHDDPYSVPDPLSRQVHETFHISYPVIVNPTPHNLVGFIDGDRQRNCSCFPTAGNCPEFVPESGLTAFEWSTVPFTSAFPETKAQKFAFAWRNYMRFGRTDFQKQFSFDPTGY